MIISYELIEYYICLYVSISDELIIEYYICLYVS